VSTINPRFDYSIKPVSLAESEYRRAVEVLTGMGFPPHWIREDERGRPVGIIADTPDMRVAQVRVHPALVVAEFETYEHIRFSYTEPVMPLNHRFQDNARSFADAVYRESHRLSRILVERRMWELNEMYTMNKVTNEQGETSPMNKGDVHNEQA
jgi:hypothetical protein